MNPLMLPDWDVSAVTETETAFVYKAKYKVEPEACPKCGVVGGFYRHGHKAVTYKDAPAFTKKTVINAEVKRYACRECGSTFMQPLPAMHPSRQLTLRSVKYLREQCLRRQYAELARDTGIDESVVRAVCNDEYAAVLDTHRPYCTVALGMDELTLLKRQRAIFIDLTTKRVIDILPSRRKDSISLWLSRLPDRGRIQIVTMDMAKEYREIVRGLLPGAAIVIDKFHVQKTANEAVMKVMARWRRARGERKRPWRLTKIMRARNLKPAGALLLDGILKNNPLLSDAWHTKEGFYQIWEAGSRADAEAAFEAWKAAIPESVSPEFGAIAGTIDRWHGEIFAYFDHRYTNALTETTNGLVKSINRGGRGYSFPTIRAKAILMEPIGEVTRFICENCLGHFPKSQEHPWPVYARGDDPMTNPPRVTYMLCDDCNRFYIETWWLPELKKAIARDLPTL